MIAILSLLLVQAPSDLGRSFDQCMNTGEAAEGVQSAMQKCIDTAYEIWDGRLNQAYKMKMMSLTPSRKLILRGMQREWIIGRDRRCKPEGNGSLDRFTSATCRTEAAVMRTRWLERYK